MTCYEIIKNQIKTLFLNKEEYPTKEMLEEKLPLFEMISACNLSLEERDRLITEIISENQISIPIGIEIIKKGWRPWLHEIENRDTYYEDRYKHYLLNNQGFPTNIVNSIFEKNEKILEYLENPNHGGSWIKKGLVMGYVQSGKTANYISLINKSADIGYKLIILIAGIHNNLREQTQKRINEGFIGKDNLTQEFVGVGKINKRRIPGSLTSTMNDFKRTNLQSLGIDPKNYKEPIILVVKKNYRTLDNIINWLKGTTDKDKLSSYPLLIIDDEADNASINTKKDPSEVTKINRQIREILNMFDRRCYIGYTATPFANIFINPEGKNDKIGEDLFPEDFIIALEAPSNYMGAKTIFLEEPDKVLREIDDNEPCLPIKHSKDFNIDCLPESLYKAIYLFLLSGAIKRLRGVKNKHHSMLINVSFRINIQEQIKEILSGKLDSILCLIKYNYKKQLDEILENNILKSIYFLWKKEYQSMKEEFVFQDILEEIIQHENLIKIVVVNSKNEPLRYDDYKDKGLNVIAIGGYSLSRGFTLEGLTISYFLRNTQMYDTLLQMGRWFGYRDGYKDLCRIFMRKEAMDWYGYIAEVVEELKEELKIMEYYKQSPRDYGLKIKDHPASLIVTARNKMYNSKNAIVEVCYSNKLIETRVLSNKKNIINKNLNLLRDFVKLLGIDYMENRNNFLWKNINVDIVLKFLNNFNNHPLNQSTDTRALTTYIEKGKNEELNNWEVALINIEKNEKYTINNNIIVGKVERSAHLEDDVLVISGKKYRVGQPSDEKIGLSDDAIEKAKELAIAMRRKKLEEENKTQDEINKILEEVKPIGNHYREFREKPLLILYVIKVKKDGLEEQYRDEYRSVVAYGISFPKIGNSDLCDENRKGIYKVNQVWWEQYYKEIEEEEYDE